MIIGFWKVEEEYGIFSNWAHVEFDYQGIHFKNSEQAFMYLKAKLFNDTEIMEKILKNGNPMICKHLGRAVKNFDSEVFSKVRYEFMYEVVYAKFSQNKQARDLLLSTNDVILAEASPLNKIWGIGMEVTNPNFEDPTKWEGANLLGKILMEVRERLKQETRK